MGSFTSLSSLLPRFLTRFFDEEFSEFSLVKSRIFFLRRRRRFFRLFRVVLYFDWPRASMISKVLLPLGRGIDGGRTTNVGGGAGGPGGRVVGLVGLVGLVVGLVGLVGLVVGLVGLVGLQIKRQIELAELYMLLLNSTLTKTLFPSFFCQDCPFRE